ncbi:Transcription factor bHLH148 [Apostasia shenzhenica]|uniref:Transcription factor bHLH148 n=1 Tax=Apostasia shenzhenica TaxID=1088818 RepID=A0A2I0BBC0_9ASPA|nr:Transcription factor bHLH148 [Apostasia shenzhenica]
MAIPSPAKVCDRKRNRSEKDLRPSPKRWRTEIEQRTYSSKLLEAIRRVRRSMPSAAVLQRSRAVRKAADRALAVAARGRTRWSRAILSSRKLKLNPRRIHRLAAPSPSYSRSKFAAAGESSCLVERNKGILVLGQKAEVLGRLVPGCRNIPFPKLLEEASDYIAALEMQIHAMSALATILSASGGAYSPP